jgi:hypothetical protein
MQISEVVPPNCTPKLTFLLDAPMMVYRLVSQVLSRYFGSVNVFLERARVLCRQPGRLISDVKFWILDFGLKDRFYSR